MPEGSLNSLVMEFSNASTRILFRLVNQRSGGNDSWQTPVHSDCSSKDDDDDLYEASLILSWVLHQKVLSCLRRCYSRKGDDLGCIIVGY